MTTLALLVLFAAPFWEARPPAEWSDQELRAFLHASPWAQTDKARMPAAEARAGANSATLEPPDQGVQLFLASAQPVREAEQEWSKRHPPAGEAAEDEYAAEFHEFMASNPGKYIALAVRLARPQQLERQKQTEEMDKRCELRIGQRRYKLIGHFMPSPGDPYLRLVFPREIQPDDEELEFTLYLPGVTLPHRKVSFFLKQLVYKGKLEL